MFFFGLVSSLGGDFRLPRFAVEFPYSFSVDKYVTRRLLNQLVNSTQNFMRFALILWVLFCASPMLVAAESVLIFADDTTVSAPGSAIIKLAQASPNGESNSSLSTQGKLLPTMQSDFLNAPNRIVMKEAGIVTTVEGLLSRHGPPLNGLIAYGAELTNRVLAGSNADGDKLSYVVLASAQCQIVLSRFLATVSPRTANASLPKGAEAALAAVSAFNDRLKASEVQARKALETIAKRVEDEAALSAAKRLAEMPGSSLIAALMDRARSAPSNVRDQGAIERFETFDRTITSSEMARLTAYIRETRPSNTDSKAYSFWYEGTLRPGMIALSSNIQAMSEWAATLAATGGADANRWYTLANGKELAAFNELWALARERNAGTIAFPAEIAISAVASSSRDSLSVPSKTSNYYWIFGTPGQISAYLIGLQVGDAAATVYQVIGQSAQDMREITVGLNNTRRAFWECAASRCPQLGSLRGEMSAWLLRKDHTFILSEVRIGGVPAIGVLSRLPGRMGDNPALTGDEGIAFACRQEFNSARNLISRTIASLTQLADPAGIAAFRASFDSPQYEAYVQYRDEFEYLIRRPARY
jgi:hypothetical protein